MPAAAMARVTPALEARGREIARSFSPTFLGPSDKGKGIFFERQARRDRYFRLWSPAQWFPPSSRGPLFFRFSAAAGFRSPFRQSSKGPVLSHAAIGRPEYRPEDSTWALLP